MPYQTLIRPSVQRSLDVLAKTVTRAKGDFTHVLNDGDVDWPTDMDSLPNGSWQEYVPAKSIVDNIPVDSPHGECYCGKPAVSDRGYCATCF